MGLTTISYDEKSRNDVFYQITEILGDRVKVNSLSYNDLNPACKVYDDLILITTPVIKDLILPFIDERCKYLIAKRTISPQKMKLLFDIPPNTDVLVVNVIYESALDVVEELAAIGIDHAKFHPYDPRKPLTNKFIYAITPGEIQLVPKDIPRVIDIGDRLFSIATISQILYHFTGNWTCDSLIDSRYIQNYVNLSMHLSENTRYNQLLHRQMEMVVANFEDGILLTNEHTVITFHNNRASELLGDAKLTGKSLEQLFPNNFKEYSDTSFIYINNFSLHITRKKVDLPETNKIEMIILKDLTQIRDIDEQYRKQKKYSGYTAKYTFSHILYRSNTMEYLIKKAKTIATTDSTVLMMGESGTGKELFAQSIHNASNRKGRPFVALNCAALSETLLESELFGYEEGAFTGALKGGKPGLFEVAHTGTIFLDEIGDAPPSIQKRLLRVLQEKEIMRVSGNKVIPIDVRIIAATNKHLVELIKKGEFREDLFYRLNVFPFHIPPLRERREDIEILLQFFLDKHTALRKQPIPHVKPSIIDFLKEYHWPGNIRQLENLAEFIATVGCVSNDLHKDVLQLLSLVEPREENDLQQFPLPTPAAHVELMAILNILAGIDNTSELIGRSAIRRRLAEGGIHLSEQQVKTRIALLKKRGLVETFPGRCTTITFAGKKLLANASHYQRDR